MITEIDDHEFGLDELADIADVHQQQAARARAWAALSDRQRRTIIRRTVKEFVTWCSHQRRPSRR